MSRREFLKVAGLGLGAVVFQPFLQNEGISDYPEDQPLGRVIGGTVPIKSAQISTARMLLP